MMALFVPKRFAHGKVGSIPWLQKKKNGQVNKFVVLFPFVVAVLGKIDDLNKSIWIATVTCGILQADPSQVVWLRNEN